MNKHTDTHKPQAHKHTQQTYTFKTEITRKLTQTFHTYIHTLMNKHTDTHKHTDT